MREIYKVYKALAVIFLLIISSKTTYSQEDVTKFLDIPVDGYKREMIETLKSKGYMLNEHSKDVLYGEFNGTDVNLFIGTNNNKVWRIGVLDEHSTDETNIRIRFNKLVHQFSTSNRYVQELDSTLTNYLISEEEDISYEISVKSKRYQATFYQKTAKYDSLGVESQRLLLEEDLSEEKKERLGELFVELVQESTKSLNKRVWFMIQEEYGEYKICIFYENVLNEANGSQL